MGGQQKMYHMKFKSNISFLGEKISILPWQMAEQLTVEVDVKNVTDGRKTLRQAHLFGKDINYILMWMLVYSNIETEMKFTYMLSVKVFF